MNSVSAGPQIIPVVICGGAGTRLWPVSRETFPKPLMALDDGQSLLQKTYDRIAALPNVAEVLTVMNRDIFFMARDVYSQGKCSRHRAAFLLEPEGRGTAAAVAAAALWARTQYGPDALLLILPADHLIESVGAFVEAVEFAARAAVNGYLATFGIVPTRPETGYGYLQVDKGSRAWGSGGNVRTVHRFVEKPDATRASKFLESGEFLWNSGMFCFSVATILKEFDLHQPAIAPDVERALCQATQLGTQPGSVMELEGEAFNQVPVWSIDQAVMEKSDRVVAVMNTMLWSDLGSWSSISGLMSPTDEQDNRIVGNAILHKARGCYIRSERLVGVVGANDLIIVDTEDALLVAARDSVEEVRQITAELRRNGHEAYRYHKKVMRPWGYYSTLVEQPLFKVKRIVVRPGQALSLQLHHHRHEHWVVVQGEATIENGDFCGVLRYNESAQIPVGQRHRLSNHGVDELVLIEVQCGDYLGEDDIVRLDDNYGRALA
ncbi:mannose-1-phosphate guanylyltransferase/mannose-6-phosphate isomerase [Allopusillimonas ginsengisoli]|uniref:mannose-1-phosphate guanylyltransferase/mannose-6-phosphate isomerase n=1 Tax=Allopusillimonas ginsengisoli TaxID=453575 RepID=UPI001021F37F|nr:mannose-1-phosphate guanylyltransferase/mannose-6-phosphate isomerase [Allopusillimonas ginsengisoli]TEA69609.1 mannose-1-phosphate guanylyltransferase/mannose-6-phosphate isomerase [Allopusillimonas ginsengisoli]